MKTHELSGGRGKAHLLVLFSTRGGKSDWSILDLKQGVS